MMEMITGLCMTDASAHINNLQNTAFWALVKSGQSTKEANKTVQVRPFVLSIPSLLSANGAGHGF